MSVWDVPTSASGIIPCCEHPCHMLELQCSARIPPVLYPRVNPFEPVPMGWCSRKVSPSLPQPKSTVQPYRIHSCCCPGRCSRMHVCSAVSTPTAAALGMCAAPSTTQQSHHIIAVLLELRIHLQGCLHITVSHRLPGINDLQTHNRRTSQLSPQAGCVLNC